jgi:hypothetical protein
MVVNRKAEKVKPDTKLIAAIVGAVNIYLEEEKRPESLQTNPPTAERL